MKLSLSKNKEPVIKRRTSVPPGEPIERRSVTSVTIVAKFRNHNGDGEQQKNNFARVSRFFLSRCCTTAT